MVSKPNKHKCTKNERPGERYPSCFTRPSEGVERVVRVGTFSHAITLPALRAKHRGTVYRMGRDWDIERTCP